MAGSGFALRAEAACAAVWSALRETAMDGWLLRFADNAAALALYRRSGFTTEPSRYHHRKRARG